MLPSFCTEDVIRIRPGTKEERGSIIPDWSNPDRLLIHGVFIPYFRGLASQFKQFDDNLRLLNQTE
jgi:heterodisulfide reductase subunit A